MSRQKQQVICVPLDELTNIETNDTLVSIQRKIDNFLNINQARVDNWEINWTIISLWIAYFRAPVVNISTYPYNTEGFRAKKSMANMLNKMLDCCEGLRNENKISLSPFKYWELLIHEKRQNEYLGMKYNISKSDHIKWLRIFLSTLKNREVPNAPALHQEFFRKCLTAAYGADRKSNKQHNINFRELYWIPFLRSFQIMIDDSERRKELRAIFTDEDGIPYYHISGRRTQQLK